MTDTKPPKPAPDRYSNPHRFLLLKVALAHVVMFIIFVAVWKLSV